MKKKIFEVPIMQVIYSSVQLIAYSEEDAIDMFHELDEDEMNYPFDFCSPQKEINYSKKIKPLAEVGGIDKKQQDLMDEESITKVVY